MRKIISTDELLAMIQKQLREGSIEGAIKICTDELILQPLNAEFYEQRAILYKISEQPELARRDMQIALKLNNKSKIASHFLFALIDTTEDHKDQTSAKSSPLNNTAFYKKMTLIYLSLKEYDTVIKYGKLAEKENIVNDEMFVNMAMAFAHLKQYDTALYYFAKALKIDANYVDIYYLRSNTYLQMTPPNYQLALDDINFFIELDKTHAKAYATRAYILFHIGKFEDSKLDCMNAIQIDKDNAEAFYTLARCHFSLKSYIQAVAAGEIQLSIEPKMMEGYYICAMSSYQLGQFTATIDFCDRGLEISNQIAVLFQLRACANMSLGKYDAAMKDYQEACRLFPEDKEQFTDRFQRASLHYENSVIKFISAEPVSEDSTSKQLVFSDRISQFSYHEKNLLTILATTQCKDYIHHVFSYCLAELYAKCQISYFCAFGDEMITHEEKDKIRIDKSARYYINVLNGLLNNSVIGRALKSNDSFVTTFNFFKQFQSVIPSSNGLLNKCIEDLQNAELIQSQKIHFLIDIIKGINQLYMQSTRAIQYFKEKLPADFKMVLKKCLNQVVKELLNVKEADVLWQHINQNADNIFKLLEVKIALQPQRNNNPWRVK